MVATTTARGPLRKIIALREVSGAHAIRTEDPSLASEHALDLGSCAEFIATEARTELSLKPWIFALVWNVPGPQSRGGMANRTRTALANGARKSVSVLPFHLYYRRPPDPSGTRVSGLLLDQWWHERHSAMGSGAEHHSDCEDEGEPQMILAAIPGRRFVHEFFAERRQTLTRASIVISNFRHG